MRRRTTLLTTALLITLSASSASPTWAYRPLTGVYKNGADAPVVTRSVSTSLADKDGKLDSNWDTTVGLEQKDARMVARIDLDFSLLGNQNRTILVHRVVLQRERPWRQGEQWEYRLQENHLGWPGESTLVQIVSVTFTNGETWTNSNKSEQKLQDLTPPDGKEKEKENATLPTSTPTPPNPPFIPPIILPSGATSGGSSSGTGFVPPVRPRVSPARPPGVSRSVPTQPTNPVAPRPSQAQSAPVPSSPGTPNTPNPNSAISPPSQVNSIPPPGGNIPGIPPASSGNQTPEELLR